MVMPMVGRPPQHAFLRGRHREERQDKLEYPAGLERAMGKIAVIPRRNGNHPQIIAADSEQHPFPLNPSLKGQEAHQMDAQKWNDIPMLKKIFPGPACEGTGGVMGRSVHTETIVPSAALRMVTLRNCSPSLSLILITHPAPAEAASILTRVVQHSPLEVHTILVISTGSPEPVRVLTSIVAVESCCRSGFLDEKRLLSGNETGDSRDGFAQHKRAPPSTGYAKGIILYIEPRGKNGS